MDIGEHAAKCAAEFLEDALNRRPQVKQGGSLSHCEDCGEPIPLARQQAVAGVRLCVNCKSLNEKQGKGYKGSSA